MKFNKLLLPLLLVTVFLSGCTNVETNNRKPNIVPVDQESLKLLPITSRKFSMGTAGYFPANFPKSSLTDIRNYWADVDSSGDIYGVHTNWSDTNIISTAANQTDVDLVLIIGFQEVSEWKNSKEDFKKKVLEILEKNPEIKYLGIGNEINVEYEKDPSQFSYFVSAYKEVYDAIKAKFPNVKVFTVFQLEAMKGEGYLTGKAEKRAPQWSVLENFSGKLDLAVFTSYPYLDHKDPSTIPTNYYSEIANYISKPMAFTEIGWPAREVYGEQYKALNTGGYTGSEQEQVDFLVRFLSLTINSDLEFVNWSFMHDFTPWENGISGDSLPVFDSIALKHNDGQEKKIWKVWLALRSLEKVK